MIKLIPWDIWAAAALAPALCLAAIFDPAPAVFVVIYLALVRLRRRRNLQQ